MINSFSKYKIHEPETFDFDPKEYSRFKFGDGHVARKYGIILAKSFIEDYLKESPITNQIVIISSPYSFIPTATFSMKNYFVYEINRWLEQHQLPVSQETKITRSISYREDYGELTAEERMNLIGNDIFHIDKEFIKGKTLIFLDDIRITGGHERMILKMLKDIYADNEIHLLYFAELVNHTIHPKVENYLNYYAVKSIFDLESIINSGFFEINTRIVKYVLNYKSEDFKVFIHKFHRSVIQEFLDMAIGNNYHTIDAYTENLTYLKSIVHHY